MLVIFSAPQTASQCCKNLSSTKQKHIGENTCILCGTAFTVLALGEFVCSQLVYMSRNVDSKKRSNLFKASLALNVYIFLKFYNCGWVVFEKRTTKHYTVNWEGRDRKFAGVFLLLFFFVDVYCCLEECLKLYWNPEDITKECGW